LNSIKKIKILILTPTLQCGGSEKFVSQICNHISTGIFSVCLVVINNAKQFYQVTNPAIEIVDLKKERVLFSIFAIKAAAKNFNPDVIFSTANHLNLYLTIFRKHFKAGTHFIAREASIVSINSKQAKFPALYNLLIKKYYKRFDCIVCQSVYMQQDLVNHYQIATNKTVIIHNAVQEGLSASVQPQKKITERGYKFITIARLSQEKGIKRLIQAVALLSVPFTYYIIGDGSEINTLQKLIDELQLQDKVFLLGEKKEPFTGMEDADLFLFGSYYEGFPNVLLEAGAHGIPVIAFNAPGGIAEIITDNGLLIEDNDIIAFATAINNGLAASFNREKIKETTEKRFSMYNMLAQIQALFMEKKNRNSMN
jgi:glycosyltransferase involved in cell wall biosynthesis